MATGAFTLGPNVPLVIIPISLSALENIFAPSLAMILLSGKIPTLNLDVPFSMHLDDNYDRIALEFDLQPNDHYKIRLSPLALEDFWGNTHDTIFYQVKTKAISDYGNLNLQLVRSDLDPFVLELLNKKGEVKGSYYTANELDLYVFPLLAPGEYLFRYIRDENDNKKWDTGNYLKKIQPEEVLYSDEPVELRANWDVNETLRIPDKITQSIKKKPS